MKNVKHFQLAERRERIGGVNEFFSNIITLLSSLGSRPHSFKQANKQPMQHNTMAHNGENVV